MYLKNHRRALIDRLFVIANTRAVGGADFFQRNAGACQNVRHAKLASDLDELAPGNYHLAPNRKGRQNKKGRCGTIVYNDRVFGARNFTNKCLNTLASASA